MVVVTLSKAKHPYSYTILAGIEIPHISGKWTTRFVREE
jgi:hypothetical protein